MKPIAATEPDSNPTVQRLLLEQRRRKLHRWLDRERRERLIEVGSAIGFAITATSMALFIDSSRSLEPGLMVALVGAYAVAARVEFATGSGFTAPTQLVLVPMLFLLPAPLVPALVAAGLALSDVPNYIRGAVRPTGAVITIGDAWHTVGPALVLIVAGATTPDWAAWPVYAAALASQFAFDFAATLLRFRVALGVPMRPLLDELRGIYLVDALLAPIGLLVAFASADFEWAFLLVLPLIGLIRIFAGEREARIEGALTLSAAYRGTAHLLGDLLSSSDEYTGSHSRSVVVLSHQVGVALEVDERVLREIEFGALLHDVGKMAVPNQIINKPGALTEDEWAVMRTHTMHGESMLEQIGGVLGEVGTVVRSHHERYDGRGYPDGLRGEEIPLAARVIACCDAFNAMTTDRPYRSAMSIAAALAELRAEAGRQFDPNVVAALIDVVDGWDADLGAEVVELRPASASRRAPALPPA